MPGVQSLPLGGMACVSPANATNTNAVQTAAGSAVDTAKPVAAMAEAGAGTAAGSTLSNLPAAAAAQAASYIGRHRSR